MNPVWRLLRNSYTRRAYETLAAAGLTAARMVEYETSIAPGAPEPSDRPDGVSVVRAPSGSGRLSGFDLDFTIPVTCYDGEWVVAATADGDAVGRALVSAGQRPYVEHLDDRIAFDGAYLRRVYVTPTWRNRGIATLLIREALGIARHELDAETAHALIAADNRPSQWAFRANGFRPVRRFDYVAAFGHEWRRTTPAPGE
jgi:GNAT superfamily N-acetyltransferase